jgi:hypothetical protein
VDLNSKAENVRLDIVLEMKKQMLWEKIALHLALCDNEATDLHMLYWRSSYHL